MSAESSDKEEYQMGFLVKGLIAPNDGVNFNDSLLIKGVDNREDSYVYFKVSKEACEKSLLSDSEQMKVLRNILQIYGLISNSEVILPSGRSFGPITKEHPFGKMPHGTITSCTIIDEEEKERNKPIIHKTIEKYDSINNIFENNSKAYLRNAIDYYNRALADERIEEKFIDLMISLESLFSQENDELALRYSLRIAFIVGCEQENKRTEIFKLTKKLYNKRSKIVHGTSERELEYEDISKFEKIINQAIRRMIHINLSKQSILELIDEAVYSDTKRQELFIIIQKAINEW